MLAVDAEAVLAATRKWEEKLHTAERCGLGTALQGWHMPGRAHDYGR